MSEAPKAGSRLVYSAAKRALDVIAAASALLITSPLMLMIAVIVKVSSRGPVFYRARRLGLDKKPFFQLKFRTMIVNAPDLRNADGSTFNADDDPRVTAAGRFLRRTSLDELPQLLNVLMGDMSLVGPRPDPPDVLDLYRPEDHARLTVKPGLTGWAVVHGRNSLTWQKRRDLDLEYVAKRSFALDVGILLRTVPLVLKRSGITGERQQ